MIARRRIEILERERSRSRRPADSGPDAREELRSRIDALAKRTGPAPDPPAAVAQVRAQIDALLARGSVGRPAGGRRCP